MSLSQTFYISQTIILPVLLLSLIFMQIALKVLSIFEFPSVSLQACHHNVCMFYHILNWMNAFELVEVITVLYDFIHYTNTILHRMRVHVYGVLRNLTSHWLMVRGSNHCQHVPTSDSAHLAAWSVATQATNCDTLVTPVPVASALNVQGFTVKLAIIKISCIG